MTCISNKLFVSNTYFEPFKLSWLLYFFFGYFSRVARIGFFVNSEYVGSTSRFYFKLFLCVALISKKNCFLSSLAFFHQLLVFMSYSEDLPHRWTHLLVNVCSVPQILYYRIMLMFCSVLVMIQGRDNAALILRNVHWVLLGIVSWVLGTTWSISYVNCWCFELWTHLKGQTHCIL